MISFRDAYLGIYTNLNEETSSTLRDAVRKASAPITSSKFNSSPLSSSPTPLSFPKKLKSVQSTSPTPTSSTPSPETPKPSPSPETPKPSPFKTDKELSDLRSSAARSTMSGPSKEAQALMSPRTKKILSGKSVYDRLPGRENMVFRNIQRAKSSEVKPPSPKPSTSSTQEPSSPSPETQTPRVVQTSRLRTSPSSSETQTPRVVQTSRPRPRTTSFPSLNVTFRGGNTRNKEIQKIRVRGDRNRINQVQGNRNEIGNIRSGKYKVERGNIKSSYEYNDYNENLIENGEFSIFDYVLEYLVSEGYADTNENALAIMTNMSEEWRQSIVEAKVDKTLPDYKRSGVRLSRYDNPTGALVLGGGQQRARRAEHEERRGKKKSR
jgi:hypothetical protein